jgi:hypothetical protein
MWPQQNFLTWMQHWQSSLSVKVLLQIFFFENSIDIYSEVKRYSCLFETCMKETISKLKKNYIADYSIIKQKLYSEPTQIACNSDSRTLVLILSCWLKIPEVTHKAKGWQTGYLQKRGGTIQTALFARLYHIYYTFKYWWVREHINTRCRKPALL